MQRVRSFSVDFCQLDWLGEQFLWVFVLDYLGFRLIEFFIAKFQDICCVFCGRKINLDRSDESFRAKFTVIEEYVKIVMRQYYVLAGLLVVPAISWIALLLGIMDYWRTLHKLVRLCARPRPSGDAFATTLLISGYMNVLLAVLSYPGMLWYFIFSADTKDCAPTWFHP